MLHRRPLPTPTILAVLEPIGRSMALALGLVAVLAIAGACCDCGGDAFGTMPLQDAGEVLVDAGDANAPEVLVDQADAGDAGEVLVDAGADVIAVDAHDAGEVLVDASDAAAAADAHVDAGRDAGDAGPLCCWRGQVSDPCGGGVGACTCEVAARPCVAGDPCLQNTPGGGLGTMAACP